MALIQWVRNYEFNLNDKITHLPAKKQVKELRKMFRGLLSFLYFSGSACLKWILTQRPGIRGV